MHLGLEHTHCTDYVEKSKVKITVGTRHYISQTNEGNFTQFWLQMYLDS